MEHHTHKMHVRFLKRQAVPFAIIIIGALVAGGVLFEKHRAAGAALGVAKTAAAADAAANIATRPADITQVNLDAAHPFLGKPDAPVSVAYWYDYQCPYCKLFESTGLSQLKAEYVDTGKVKIVFKGMPLQGDDSRSAALAERGIWESHPEKFWEWHQAMFAKQDKENAGWGNRKDIVALMTQVGLDGKQLDGVIEANARKYQSSLEGDINEAQAFGITGTPGFIVGKKLIVGSGAYSELKAEIDAELAAK